MNGVYEPTSWKRYANWAPKEDDKDSVNYLSKIELLANQSQKLTLGIRDVIITLGLHLSNADGKAG